MLTNLDQVPPTGLLIVVQAAKVIRDANGLPVRAFRHCKTNKLQEKRALFFINRSFISGIPAGNRMVLCLYMRRIVFLGLRSP